MVDVEPLEEPEEIAAVRAMIDRHVRYTHSSRGRAVLDQWDHAVKRFVKILPRDYKRMLACISRAHDQGLTGEEAIMRAFEENARDLSRVGGN
jgi:glutamate synthase domain-containing protein 3